MPQPPKPTHAPTPAQQAVTAAETSVEKLSGRHTDAPRVEEAGRAGPASLVGQTFDDFELLQEVGRGGMGVVYLARQKSLDRRVALKMLLADHSHNEVLRARFLAEARAAAALTHPNIVAVYQVGECPAGQYFVMEYVDGPTLETLAQQRTLPVSWAVNLLISVTEAVRYAHSKGIIHRDLKPANIMIDQLRRPVVMDFGIAKVMGKSSSLTQQGTLVGTPAYMPPEQAGEEAADVGPHSDVYSLGAILYSLLTGRAPYDAGTALKTILKVIAPDPPPAVRSFRPEVPPALEDICMKCLNKQPADRYPSAQALAKALRRYRTGSPSPKEGSSSLRIALPVLALVAKKTGKQVRLFTTITTIGRASDCDMLVKAADVSKRHCRILLEADRVEVEDLGSANGTFVNGQLVQRARLQHGDELDLAGHVFEIHLQWPTKPGERGAAADRESRIEDRE